MNTALALLMPFALAGGPPGEKLGPAPVLYVKVVAPEGARATFYPGGDVKRTLNTPTPIALRPGYRYHFRLDNLPDMIGVSLFPSIEIRGSLNPPRGFDISKYPVPIVLNENDLVRIRQGALVTKVLYLEDPNQAIPEQSDPNLPLEINSPNELEAIQEGRDRGRIMVVFRVGEKSYTQAELTTLAVPGTVLLPGDPSLGPAQAPPHFMAQVYPLYDPILGPKPLDEECFFDGGDPNLNLGIGEGGRVGGLDPSETAMEFTVGERRRVTTSNRVCVCVPRFIALRVLTLPGGFVHLLTPGVEKRAEGYSILDTRVPALRVDQADAPRELMHREALLAIQSRQAPDVLIQLSRAEAFAKIERELVVADVVAPVDITQHGCRFMLKKWLKPGPPHHIGDEVTFFLRYTNNTNQVMTDVAVSDNLTGRLEYVPDSAMTDREATFTYTPNEAGSSILRWSITAPLPPGQSGTVSFRARIR